MPTHETHGVAGGVATEEAIDADIFLRPDQQYADLLKDELEKALELEHKEAKEAQMEQEKARLEQELIQVRLGAAVSEPTASHKKVGEAAAARLMQQLSSQGQHGQQQQPGRTERQCTSLSKQERASAWQICAGVSSCCARGSRVSR